jgi:hypothetical protein
VGATDAATEGSTVARTGTVETSAVAAGVAAASVGSGVASSDRHAKTMRAPTTRSADHLASREARIRFPSKVLPSCANRPVITGRPRDRRATSVWR